MAPLESARFTRSAFLGPVGSYIEGVIDQWLLVAPRANPAMLEMFRDRDNPPLRPLVPWAGEFAGKYLTAATQVLAATGDERLRAWLGNFVSELLSLQDEDGYIGPWPRGSRLTGHAPNCADTWDAWGHYHVAIGLMLWSDLAGDRKALEAAARIGDLLCAKFLGDRKPRLVDTGSTEMNLAPAHALCLLHERTGRAEFLALALQLVDEFAARGPDGAFLAGD